MYTYLNYSDNLTVSILDGHAKYTLVFELALLPVHGRVEPGVIVDIGHVHGLDKIKAISWV